LWFTEIITFYLAVCQRKSHTNTGLDRRSTG